MFKLLNIMSIVLPHSHSLSLFQAAESEMCPSFSAAMKAGKPVYTDAQPSLADGLAVPKVSLQYYYWSI